MENLTYIILVIFIAAIVTWLTRAIPFLIFGNRELPEKVKYLGGVLPPAIMIILVVYCLRNINFKNINSFLPELSSSRSCHHMSRPFSMLTSVFARLTTSTFSTLGQ